MRISFRTDSSNLIGSGHIIRCLKLAKELKSRGHKIIFISRDHEGNLINLIEENFQVYKLSLSDKNFYKEDNEYIYITGSKTYDNRELIKATFRGASWNKERSAWAFRKFEDYEQIITDVFPNIIKGQS